MGIIKDCKKYFGTRNLYEVLGISNSATEKELKKSYYKASLKVHPDRVEESEKDECTEKFKILGKVYSILSDSERRAVYDDTGEVDEEMMDSEKDWDQYWRLYFKKFTIDDVKNFEKVYRGSEEELADLMKAYNDGEGDIEYILNNVLCATIDDEARFTEIINNWIKEETVESFSKFVGDSKKDKAKRKRKANSEAAEAEQLKKDLGLGETDNDLKNLIQKRAAARAEDADAFFDHLAQKYASKPKGGKKKK